MTRGADRTAALADDAERTRIRTALDETLVVEAAAGTGKTTELVNRMVAVVESGRARVHQLVAVTFTEKAAGELKLRLRAELERARRTTKGGETARRRLEHALARLEEARVGTIHGFCGDLLRERSVDAGVDPEFETMAEPEAKRLFQEAFDLWLQETLESPPPGVRRSLRRIQARPRRSLGPTNGTEVDEDGPVGRLQNAAWALAEWRDFRCPWRREPLEREAEIDALVERLHAFAALTERCARPDKDNLHRDTLHLRRTSAELTVAEEDEADDAGARRDYDALEARLVDLAMHPSLTRGRKGYGKSYGDDVSRQAVLDARDVLRDRLAAFREAADADLAALLQGELLAAVDRYDSLKRKLGRLDFVDLLARARDLVRDDPRVRAEYQARFTHIFIDEFQDTDPLQAELLLLLAASDPATNDWRRVEPVPGKLFVVGDPKQSIYRFRRADVGTYLDVKEQLVACGAVAVSLTTSFRAVPDVQAAVNAAFGAAMEENRRAYQAGYVALAPHRPPHSDQPAVVALPVPQPHGQRGVTKTAIQSSLPDAVGAFVDWIVNESGWTVTERGGEGERVPVAARHVCLLFRRLYGWYEGDITGGYIDALEARDVPHLIVGGRSFHDKEEVATLRTALSAIEWPDDELSVFATLRGPLFAVGDEELLEFKGVTRTGSPARRLHPLRSRGRDELDERLQPIVEGLEILRALHLGRNRRPIADTIAELLERTRAHAGLALRRSGEQALANVLHVADQARRYEATGGISFRGFVERLIDDAREGRTPEAPVLEDGSDGVRIMTVHKGKGLEFPIVVLADMNAAIASRQATRHVDPERRLAAMRIGAWSPRDLLDSAEVELERDLAEGVRLAYVAATRARDVLVVPAIGEGPGAFGRVEETGGSANWISPLNAALFPSPDRWRAAEPAPGAPGFGKESVIRMEDPTIVAPPCVVPGCHAMDGYAVTWWDPHELRLGRRVGVGVRKDLERLIARNTPPAVVEAGRREFEGWASSRARAIEAGGEPSVRVETATARAERLVADGTLDGLDPAAVEIVQIETDRARRPGGKRFGALVHAVLASVPLGASREELAQVARLEGRMLGAPPEEIAVAEEATQRVLAHSLLARARGAEVVRREVPVTTVRSGVVVDGVIDLCFREAGAWTVVDFKTDPILVEAPGYRLQVAGYLAALADAGERTAAGVILHV